MSDGDLAQKIRRVNHQLTREEPNLSGRDAVISEYTVQSLRKVLRQLEAEEAAVVEDGRPCSKPQDSAARHTDAAP